MNSVYVIGIDNHLEMTFDDLDHNLDTEKEFFTTTNTLGQVPHLYRTEMKNSLDGNREKWRPSWK